MWWEWIKAESRLVFSSLVTDRARPQTISISPSPFCSPLSSCSFSPSSWRTDNLHSAIRITILIYILIAILLLLVIMNRACPPKQLFYFLHFLDLHPTSLHIWFDYACVWWSACTYRLSRLWNRVMKGFNQEKYWPPRYLKQRAGAIYQAQKSKQRRPFVKSPSPALGWDCEAHWQARVTGKALVQRGDFLSI